jgi:heme-degrading monooxygenase HmoA
MFARINTLHWSSPPEPALLERWSHEIQRRPGFKGFLALDTGEGRGLTITLWESEEAGDRWAHSTDFEQILVDLDGALAQREASNAIVTMAVLRDVVV